jgi:very-short-patch-repair endonuclease
MPKVYNKLQQKEYRRSLRNNMPKAEVVVWMYIKNKQVEGFKFHRQYGIDKYIADFYCPKLKLVLEIDGYSHMGNRAQEYDANRTKYFESIGLKVVRIANEDVLKNISGVMEGIIGIVNELKVKYGK